MFQFGPYSPSHATAGTFAFKRELLKDHKYDDNAALAEEKAFLKDYSVPFVQLEPKKTILVFSHIHNTFDKKRLLESGENNYQKTSDRTVDEFIKDKDFKEFYTEKLDGLLKNYYPGDPINKPDVIQQIKEIDEERRKMALEQQNTQGQIILNQDGKQIPLNNEQVVDIMRKQQEQLQHFVGLLQEKDSTIVRLENKVEDFENNNSNNNSNKYKIQLEEETQRFSKVIQEKNTIISKLEAELVSCKKQKEEFVVEISHAQTQTQTQMQTHTPSHSDVTKQLDQEKDNKLIVLEKELTSCKNTIDKLNILIDILNKK
jgi:hypothetical protein